MGAGRDRRRARALARRLGLAPARVARTSPPLRPGAGLRYAPGMNVRNLSLALSSLIALAACSSSKPQVDPQPTAAPPAEPAPTATAEVPAPMPELPAVELVKGEHAPAPAKAPTIAIKAPTKEQVIAADKAGDFEVKLDLKDWPAPEGGNHVHLILDNRPYKRIDDPKAPIKLKDLDPSYALAEGHHVLVAFPSRSTHESVKPIGKAVPLAVTTFWVGKKGQGAAKATDPMFIFSRPKGANDGPPPAEGILVDFYLSNVELGEGKHSISATLSGPGAEKGVQVSIKEWAPFRIKNVRDGAYDLKMTLLGPDGKPVPGAWNDTARQFTVNTKAAADSHAHPAPTAAK